MTGVVTAALTSAADTLSESLRDHLVQSGWPPETASVVRVEWQDSVVAAVWPDEVDDLVLGLEIGAPDVDAKPGAMHSFFQNPANVKKIEGSIKRSLDGVFRYLDKAFA
jgi:hypothetical protein